MEERLSGSRKRHADFQARDARAAFGWRFTPRIIFKAGNGTNLVTWTTKSTTT